MQKKRIVYWSPPQNSPWRRRWLKISPVPSWWVWEDSLNTMIYLLFVWAFSARSLSCNKWCATFGKACQRALINACGNRERGPTLQFTSSFQKSSTCISGRDESYNPCQYGSTSHFGIIGYRCTLWSQSFLCLVTAASSVAVWWLCYSPVGLCWWTGRCLAGEAGTAQWPLMCFTMSIITPKRKNRALGEDNLLVTTNKPWVLLIFISAWWNVIASPFPPHKKK